MKMTIYIPDQLKARMDTFDLNWSGIAQKAFQEAMNAMQPNIIWQSKNFTVEKIVATYARGFSDDTIKFIDVNDKNKTIREYWEHRRDVPPEISAQVHTATAIYDNVKLKEPRR